MIFVSTTGFLLRFWSPEFIINEFDKLVEMGVETIRIADEMFLLNPKYYIPLAELLSESTPEAASQSYNTFAYSVGIFSLSITPFNMFIFIFMSKALDSHPRPDNNNLARLPPQRGNSVCPDNNKTNRSAERPSRPARPDREYKGTECY